MKIRSIKLISTELIVARILEETESTLKIAYPLLIQNSVAGKHKDQVMNLEVLRWDFSSEFDAEIDLYKTAVMYTTTPTEHMRLSYTKIIQDYIGMNSSAFVDEISNEIKH